MYRKDLITFWILNVMTWWIRRISVLSLCGFLLTVGGSSLLVNKCLQTVVKLYLASCTVPCMDAADLYLILNHSVALDEYPRCIKHL